MCLKGKSLFLPLQASDCRRSFISVPERLFLQHGHLSAKQLLDFAVSIEGIILIGKNSIMHFIIPEHQCSYVRIQKKPARGREFAFPMYA